MKGEERARALTGVELCACAILELRSVVVSFLTQATEGQGFDSRLKAVQAATSESIEQLTRKLAGHREEERTAKERRHQLVSRLTACKGVSSLLSA